MAHTISLTDVQYNTIMSEFFAASQNRTRMSKDEVEKLAAMLNKKINIPFFFSEPKEFAILVKIVTKIDMFLYNKLPNEIYDSIRSLDDGIVSDAEAKQVVVRLSKLANETIDIPYLSEITEHFVIRLLVGSIVNGMRKNWTLDKSIVHANDISVPEDDFGDDEDEDDEDFLFG